MKINRNGKIFRDSDFITHTAFNDAVKKLTGIDPDEERLKEIAKEMSRDDLEKSFVTNAKMHIRDNFCECLY